MRKTGKRVLSLLLAAFMLLAYVPNVALAEDPSKYEVGPYYEVDENGDKTGDPQKYPERIVTDEDTGNYVKYSKTISEDDIDDDVFEVTLNVKTNENLSEIPQAASVVLVFDVSESMDRTLDNKYPGTPEWNLDDTKWAALKKAAKEFIENFFADEDPDNQISIVVYGGNSYAANNTKIANHTVYKTICDWTNCEYVDLNGLRGKDYVIDTFDKYDTVSQETIDNANLTGALSLRYGVFGDTGIRYGGSINSQAGFRGAIYQLGSYNNSNSPYVVFMSVGDADDCIDLGAGSLRDEDQSYESAKTEAGELKAHYDCTLYTVGFGEDALDSKILHEGDDNNPYVDEYFPANDAGKLEELYSKINDRIKSLSQAWKVTDPMSDFVTFSEVLSGDSYTVDGDGTITWDLLNATAVEDPEGVYTYTLKYTIKLNDNTDWVDYTLTNKDTVLTYLFSDENGKIEPPDNLPQAHFLVPTVKGLPDGSILKTANSIDDGTEISEVRRGETFEYTIKASNYEGTATWKNVVATDILNSDLTYVGYESSDGVTVDESDGTLTIDFGDIARGEDKEVTLTVKVNSDAAFGELENTVTAVSDNDDDQTDDYDVNVIGPDGSITKIANSTEVQPGRSYTYTITASNSGNATEAWENVTATDILDSVLSFESYTSQDGAIVTYDESENKLVIEFGDIDPAESKSVEITVNVSDTAEAGYKIPNKVSVTGDNDLVDPKEDEDPIKPEVIVPDGSIEKIASATEVKRGEVYYYTITATNGGTATWENVAGTDILDSNYIIFDSYLSTQGVTVSNDNGTLSINFGDIPAGESKTVLVYVKVNSNAEIDTRITNTVTAKGDNDIPVNPDDPDDPDNIIKGEDPVQPLVIGPNGGIAKVANVIDGDGNEVSINEVRAGEEYYYTITASNINGDAEGNKANEAWKDVVATDQLDGSLTYVNYEIAEGSDITVTESGGKVTINFGDIEVDAVKAVRIHVRANSDVKVLDTINNKVIAESSNDIDKEAEYDVDIIGPIGAIEKTSSVSKVQPGDTYSYTITASNSEDAPEAWKDVVATDTLDNNLSYVDFESSDGVTVTNDNGTLTIDFGDIGKGESKEVTINVTVNANAKAGTVIENSVIADGSNNPDPPPETDDPDPPVVTYPIGSIAKTSSVDEASRGDVYYYTITATNSGNETWENVVGTDMLDSNYITFDSYLSTQGVTVSNDNGTLTINFGDIPADESRTVLIYVKVNADAEIGKNIENEVTVEGDNTPPDVTIDPGEDPDPPMVVGPDGSIYKEPSVTQIRLGESYYYTVVASNDGNRTWENVIATDALDSSLNYKDFEIVRGGGITVAESGGTVTINFGDIDAGESKEVKIYVTVNPDTDETEIYNTVTVKSNNSPDVEYDSDQVDIIGPVGTFEKTSSVDEVRPGGRFEYTITASNHENATEAWKSVIATDVLDNDLTFAGIDSDNSSPGVTVTDENGTLTISFGDIPVGQSKQVTINVTVSGSAEIGKTINNVVTGKGSNDLPDTNITGEDPEPPVVIGPIGGVSKYASVSDVGCGEIYYYTITANNSGNQTWENVVGTDVLENNYITFDSYLSTQGVTVSNDNGTLTINFGDIPAGESRTVLIYVRVNADAEIGAKIPNAIIVSGSNNIDPDEPIKGEDPVEPVVVGPAGSISKEASVAEVPLGGEYYYTITATNDNSATAAWKNVIATDDLNASGKLNYVGSSIVQGDGITISESNGVVTINFGDIGIGATKTVRIDVSVKANAEAGALNNTVTAKSGNYPDVSDNAEVDVVSPSGTITKTSSVNEVQRGESFEYTITASNSADATDTWRNVVSTDVLDSNLTYVSFTGSQGVTVTNNNGTLTINFGNINRGDSKYVKITVQVSEDAVPGTTINNSVTTKGGNDPVPPPDVTDPDPPIVVEPAGSITKTASADAVQTGQGFYYTITVTNSGTTAWKNVIATDDLNASGKLDYVGSSVVQGDGITISESSGVVTINFGDVGIGVTKTVRIDVSVKAGAEAGALNNTVTATSSNYKSVEASYPVTVAGADGTITKRANSSTVIQGETYTYTITAVNGSTTGTWKNVVATDQLDTGLITYVSSTGDAAVAHNNGVLTINFGDIEARGTKTVTISVTVNWGVAAGTRIPNSVTVTSDGNDPKTAEDPVKPEVLGPELTATKTSNRGEKTIATDSVTYEITVKNTGKAPAYDVVVNDNIAEGVDFVTGSVEVNGAATSSYNYANGVLKVSIGNLAVDESATVTFMVQVTAAAIGKSIENTGTATGYSNKNHGPNDTPDLSDDFSDNNTTPVERITLIGDHVAYIIGYPDDGTVRPENNISRAETATIVFRLLEAASRKGYWSKTNNFSDVESDKWYNNAISTLSKAGIVEGYPEGIFKPNEYITRAEFAVMLARFNSDIYVGADKFTDLDEAEWAKEYINRAAEKGWVEGYGDGTFRPNEYIKRDEAMTMINRVLGRDNIESMHDDMVTWPDNPEGTWYYEAVQEATNSHDYVRNDDDSETWTAWLEPPDWAALEKAWAELNG